MNRSGWAAEVRNCDFNTSRNQTPAKRKPHFIKAIGPFDARNYKPTTRGDTAIIGTGIELLFGLALDRLTV